MRAESTSSIVPVMMRGLESAVLTAGAESPVSVFLRSGVRTTRTEPFSSAWMLRAMSAMDRRVWIVLIMCWFCCGSSRRNCEEDVKHGSWPKKKDRKRGL